MQMSADTEAERAALKVPASHAHSGTIKMTHTLRVRLLLHVCVCLCLFIFEILVFLKAVIHGAYWHVCVPSIGPNGECVYLCVCVC